MSKHANPSGRKLLYWFLRRRFLLSAIAFSVVLAQDVLEAYALATGFGSIGGLKANVSGYVATAGIFAVSEGIVDAVRAFRGSDAGVPWEPSSSEERVLDDKNG